MSEYIHRASFVPMMKHAGRIKGRIRYRTYFDAVAKMLPTTEFVGDVLPLWVSALGSKKLPKDSLVSSFFTRSAPQPRTPWMNSTLLTISQTDDFETRFNWFFAGAREDAELLTHASVTNEQYASALLFALCFPDIMPALTQWWVAENPTDLFRLADIAMSGIPPQNIPTVYENDIDVDLISSFIAGEGKVMTAHVYRPGYIDITKHAASLFDDLGLTVDQETWFLHFVAHYPLDKHTDTLITPWLRTFGGEESMDDFLFQFFYSRMSNIAAWDAPDRQSVVLRDTIVSPSGWFAEEFQRMFGIAISNAGISRYDWALVHGDISDDDWALVVLFELCFPDTSVALIPWLRADGSTDPFRLAELLRLGMDIKGAREALENDVDVTLMSSMLTVRNEVGA